MMSPDWLISRSLEHVTTASRPLQNVTCCPQLSFFLFLSVERIQCLLSNKLLFQREMLLILIKKLTNRKTPRDVTAEEFKVINLTPFITSSAALL